MRGKTQPLTFPANSLDAMRSLQDLDKDRLEPTFAANETTIAEPGNNGHSSENKFSPTTTDTESVSVEQAVPLLQTNEQMSIYANKQVRKQALAQVSNQSNEQVRTEISGVPPLESIIRDRLKEKRRHPSGKKSSVDTPAELDLRMKRYALDHSGLSVRDMFLEATIAFLEREGY